MPYVYSPPNGPGVLAVLGGLQVPPGDPGLDTNAPGALVLGEVNATSIDLDAIVGAPLGGQFAGAANANLGLGPAVEIGNFGNPFIQSFNRGASFTPLSIIGSTIAFTIGATTMFNIDAGGHLISSAVGAPATSALGANVTSATFTGNDVRGTITIVMSAGLAANTRVCTATFAATYGATPPKVTLVDQTSGVGLAIVNSYVLAQATGVSFDIAFDQALVAGTYIIDYIVIG